MCNRFLRDNALLLCLIVTRKTLKTAFSVAICLMCFVPVNEIYGSNLLRRNVVQIHAGFGFIVQEKGNALYIVSAKHVAELALSQNSGRLPIRFYRSEVEVSGEVVQKDDNLDLVLIRVDKPGGFAWQFRGATRNGRIGDQVSLIGSNREWKDLPKQSNGFIRSANENIVVADFPFVSQGSSGGPLICNDKIVGLIVHDDGTKVYAYSTLLVMNKVRLWTRTKWLTFNDQPNFLLGFQLESFDKPTTTESFNTGVNAFGVFSEVAMTESHSIQIGYTQNYASDSAENGQTTVRNNFNRIALNLFYYPNSSLIIRALSNYFNFSYEFVKFSYQLRDESGVWQDIEYFDDLGYSYDKYGSVFSIGAGGFVNIGEFRVKLGIEYKLWKPEIVFINPNRRFEKAVRPELMLSFGLSVGYVMRMSTSKVRDLR